jgi:hypothetical protein
MSLSINPKGPDGSGSGPDDVKPRHVDDEHEACVLYQSGLELVSRGLGLMNAAMTRHRSSLVSRGTCPTEQELKDAAKRLEAPPKPRIVRPGAN